jgi:hypothetical protein
MRLHLRPEFLAILLLLIVAGLAGLHHQQKFQQQSTLETLDRSSSPSTINPNPDPRKKETKSDDQFAEQLKRQAARVSAIDVDPDKTQRELERLAASLTPLQIEFLKQRTLSTRVDGDERSLSVYLLSLSPQDGILETLTEIAVSPLPSTSNDRVLTFEETLRATAIDGILRRADQHASEEKMKEINGKTDSVFLKDWVARGLAYLHGAAASPEEQAHQALMKLLKKSR